MMSVPDPDAPVVEIHEDDANGVVELDPPEDLFGGVSG